MIENRAILLILLAVMLIGFIVSATVGMEAGGVIILIGVLGYFMFNKKP